MASPAEVFEAFRQAHATADADAAAALYAPDAVYYEPDNVPHRGRDEIRTHLASVYAVRSGPAPSPTAAAARWASPASRWSRSAATASSTTATSARWLVFSAGL